MRWLAAAVALGAGLAAQADRMIGAPIGAKMRSDEARIEYIWTAGDGDRGRWYFGTGVGLHFDIEVLYERLACRQHALTFDFAYNYLPPIVDFAPGISLGVMDVLDRTRGGRSPYIAITTRLGQYGDFNTDAPAEFTFGVRAGRRGGFFTSAVLPFARQFSLLVEHDALRLTAGFEVSPVQGVSLRWLFRQDETLLSLRYSWRL